MKKTLIAGALLGVTLAGAIAAPASANDVEHFQFPLPAGCGGVQAGDNLFDVTTVSDAGYPHANGDDRGRYVATHKGLRFDGRYTDVFHGRHRTIRLWDDGHRFVTIRFVGDQQVGDRCYLREHR